MGFATVAPAMSWDDPKTYIGLVTATTSFQGNVTLNPSSAFIGLVTATGSLSLGGNVTLNPGPNYIGLATVNVGNQRYSYVNITSSTTVAVKGSSGFLHSLTINTRGTGSAVVLYDNTVGAGTKIATIDTTLSTTAFLYDVNFTTGLVAHATGVGAADLTVSYL